MTGDLYFIGCIPEPPVSDEIWQFKLLVRDRFGSRKSLSSPPHITLFPPFRAGSDTIEAVRSGLMTELRRFRPFDVHILGFGTFRRDVLFVQPDMTVELSDLEKAVRLVCVANGLVHPSPDRPFNPHLTIGIRDFKGDSFERARKYFFNLEYNRTACISSITLFHHNGDRWISEEFLQLDAEGSSEQ